MGRRQTMQEKFKIQMKAYRKKKMKVDNTPYLPLEGDVYVMNSLNPTDKIKAEVLKTKEKDHRHTITSLACPQCGEPMSWDSHWEAFICLKHEKKLQQDILKLLLFHFITKKLS